MEVLSEHRSHYEPLYTHLKKGNLFSLICVNFEHDQVTAFNRHHHMELILVETGTLGCFIEDRFFTAVCGDLVVINPLQAHRLAPINQEPLTVWALSFDEKLLHADGLEIGDRNFEELVKDSEVAELFRGIIQEQTRALSWHTAYIQNLIRLLLLHLLRDYATISPDVNKVPPLLQTIISYIHTNFAQPLTLEIIGNEVGISRWYLSKFFKKETGLSIIDYINQYRCSRALVLLLKSDYPISKISEMCGFSSLEYFSKVYAKQYGHPPSRERDLKSKNDLSLGLFASSLAASADEAIAKSRNKVSDKTWG